MTYHGEISNNMEPGRHDAAGSSAGDLTTPAKVETDASVLETFRQVYSADPEPKIFAPSSSEEKTADDVSDRKFFVGGLPPVAWEQDLVEYFRSFGEVANVKVVIDQWTQRHRGFGFVEMVTKEAADLVLKHDAHIVRGKQVQVRRMENEGASLQRKIFVGGINPALDEAQLESYFLRFGPIEQTTIVRDSASGRSKGFGFVLYAHEDSAKNVLQSRVHMVTAQDKVDIRPAESRRK